jgi:hypothetical protein
MPGATSEFAATLIASDNASNFERTDVAMLGSSSPSENASNFERTDAATVVVKQLD